MCPIAYAVALLSVIFLVVLAEPSHAAPGPQQAPELKVLDSWTGRWTTHGKLYETPYSHAGEITINSTCGWSAHGAYMICDQIFKGPAGTHNDLTVYTYNPADKSYKFCGFDRAGTPSSNPVVVEGSIWSYDRDQETDGKKIHIKTINDFSKPGVVTWNTKFTADGVHWTLMNEGVDVKEK